MQTFWVEDNKSNRGFFHDGTIASACKVAQDWCFSDNDNVSVFLDNVVRVADVNKNQVSLTAKGCSLFYQLVSELTIAKRLNHQP